MKKERIKWSISGILVSALLVALIALALSMYPPSPPTTAPFPTTKAQVTTTQQNYVASAKSDKYHAPTCDYVDRILTENRVYYATKEQARAAGKIPCLVCRP